MAALSNVEQIINELKAGHLVLLPANGQKLSNPHYTAPGPLTHMLVITGYISRSDEFVTNDSGTKRGRDYRYKTATVMAAAWNYPTGPKVEEQTTADKAIIIVNR